jgi:hypothetical protein
MIESRQDSNPGTGPTDVAFEDITGDPMDNAALASYLENVNTLSANEFKVLYFASIVSAASAIAIPTGATVLLDELQGLDAIVETLDVNGEPTGQTPVTAGGVPVTVTSFDAAGNYVLSGTPSAFPVALLYVLKIGSLDWQNLVTDNIIAFEIGGIMKAAAAGHDGKEGLVPKPLATQQDSVLTGAANFRSIAAILGYTPVNPSIGAMIKTLFKQNVTITHTGTLVETIIYSVLIPAGTFQANDFLKWFIQWGATSNANNKTLRTYFNTSVSLVGAIFTGQFLITTNQSNLLARQMAFKNSLNAQQILPTSAGLNSEYSISSTAMSTLAVDFSVDQYFIISAQQAVAGDTTSIFYLYANMLR